MRRTDKVGTEAAFHPVEEYMVHVEEWFDMLELTQKVRDCIRSLSSSEIGCDC